MNCHHQIKWLMFSIEQMGHWFHLLYVRKSIDCMHVCVLFLCSILSRVFIQRIPKMLSSVLDFTCDGCCCRTPCISQSINHYTKFIFNLYMFMLKNENPFEYIIYFEKKKQKTTAIDHPPTHSGPPARHARLTFRLLNYNTSVLNHEMCVCVSIFLLTSQRILGKIIFICSISFWRASQRWIAIALCALYAAQFSIYFPMANIQ